MRVLLTAPSSNGRLRNLVPLAWALRTAGHDVLIV
jgi:UDP:flavonoid glycosyltransferase YjiC (YdhE family)